MSSMSKLPLTFNPEKRKWMRNGKSSTPPSKSRRLSDSKSPEPNCPICLGPIDGESFASGCFHSFCRVCLFEWSKVKAECPVCRRPFEQIIFNVENVDKYEFLKVQHANTFQTPSTFTFWTAHGSYEHRSRTIPRYSISEFISPGLSLISRPSLSIQINRSSSHLRRIGECLGWGYSGSTHQPFHRHMRYTSTNSTSTTSNLPSTSTSTSSGNPNVPGTVEHRRSLYNNDLWAKSNDERRSRISSASFYRDNPSLTHRLQPFVYRELTALIQSEFEASFLAQRVMDGLLMYDIRSRSFRRIVESFLVGNTDHFIHEFYSFATSPHEFNDYDLKTNYVPKNQTVIMTTVPPVPPLGINYELDENEHQVRSSTNNLFARRSTSNSRDIACIEISDDSDDESLLQLPSTSKVNKDESSRSNTKTEPEAQVDNGCNLNINIIDDFENPQPGPSRLNQPSNIQVNIQCRTDRRMFMDSDDDSSDVDVDSEPRPHSFIPIFPSHPTPTQENEESDDSIIILEEEKPEPLLIDLSSDEESVDEGDRKKKESTEDQQEEEKDEQVEEKVVKAKEVKENEIETETERVEEVNIDAQQEIRRPEEEENREQEEKDEEKKEEKVVEKVEETEKKASNGLEKQETVVNPDVLSHIQDESSNNQASTQSKLTNEENVEKKESNDNNEKDEPKLLQSNI